MFSFYFARSDSNWHPRYLWAILGVTLIYAVAMQSTCTPAHPHCASSRSDIPENPRGKPVEGVSSPASTVSGTGEEKNSIRNSTFPFLMVLKIYISGMEERRKGERTFPRQKEFVSPIVGLSSFSVGVIPSEAGEEGPWIITSKGFASFKTHKYQLFWLSAVAWDGIFPPFLKIFHLRWKHWWIAKVGESCYIIIIMIGGAVTRVTAGKARTFLTIRAQK